MTIEMPRRLALLKNLATVAVGGTVLAGGVACGGSAGDEGTLPRGSRGGDAREQCLAEGASVEATDVDGDGRPDLRHVRRGGRLACSELDLNRDGRTDVVRFYGADGSTVVREEQDFDFDGRLDQIVYFENGQLARKELDTDFDNAIDTWLFCDQGRVARAERDRRGRGRPDTWEQYEQGLIVEARYDNNNDDRPEKWEIFEAGRLKEIRTDTDNDGQPDRVEQIPSGESGPPDEPIRCDVTATLPEPGQAAPAAPTSAPPTQSEEPSPEPAIDTGVTTEDRPDVSVTEGGSR